MLKAKKVVVFIVEGISDRVSLAHVVASLNKDKRIFFQIVAADITSDFDTSNMNVIKKINAQVKECMMKQHFNKNDIIKIVHLVDTDGVFVPSSSVIYSESVRIKYSDEWIETNDVEKIRDRNKRKSSILNRLSSTSAINNIPYEIYYFSTNIEHVLHNIQNAKDNEKMALAEKFEDEYYNNPTQFLNFINGEFSLKDGYRSSWDYIKEENNSLKRYTNFNQFFMSK
ncbi:MAG: hypothetical protein IJ220_04415 [Clostridia bacterium]|nr:hypothetical protein [Clostridia bacterium]